MRHVAVPSVTLTLAIQRLEEPHLLAPPVEWKTTFTTPFVKDLPVLP